MAYDKLPTKPLKVTLAVATIELLKKLMGEATHGTSIPDVAKTLIEEGLRTAKEKGHLKE
jgi:hypothetical protein